MTELIVDTDALDGVGSFLLRAEQTASPRPPITECSSAVMILARYLPHNRKYGRSRQGNVRTFAVTSAATARAA